MSQLLQVSQLQVDFETRNGLLTAIRDVELAIDPGEIVCIVGESGSGKTVASKSIMRLIEFDNGRISKGSITLNGLDVTTLSDKQLRTIRGSEIAMIFQEPMSAFDPVFTVGHQIVETILQHKNISTKAAKERAIYLLNRVGISDATLRFRQYPNELSGGMLQRAMIAMALACNPKLLIADEPTTALDVTIQAQILNLLEELKEEFRMSILLITHDMGVAAQVADRIVVMYAGEIVEEAETVELFNKPMHPYSIGLLQSITHIDSDKNKPLYSINGSIPSLSDLPSGCLFHPRCPFATDLCLQQKPKLEQICGRKVACWYAEREKKFEQDEEVVSLSEVEIVGENLSRNIEPLMTIQKVSKYYPSSNNRLFQKASVIKAVDNVSFTIFKGETFGLVGESGSGKSTLGRLLLQLEKVTSGSVEFDGVNLTNLKASDLRKIRKHLQMVYQDPYGSVNSRWTVGRIIEEPLQVHLKNSKEDNQAIAYKLLEAVGLNKDAYEKYPHEFSGGQRQRIAIARAIALNPKMLIADEAVSALDVSVQAQIINLLKDLQKQLDLTILFIGHGLNIVRHVSDRIGVMYLGELVEIANSETLFQSPTHPYTKLLIESIPTGHVENKAPFSVIQGEIPSPVNPPTGCKFHTRCPFAQQTCKTIAPKLQEILPGHFSSCHFPLVPNN